MRSLLRQEIRLGMAGSTCGLCGHVGQMITQTRRVRRGLDRLNPRWDAAPEAWEVCPSCSARRALEESLAVLG